MLALPERSGDPAYNNRVSCARVQRRGCAAGEARGQTHDRSRADSLHVRGASQWFGSCPCLSATARRAGGGETAPQQERPGFGYCCGVGELIPDPIGIYVILLILELEKNCRRGAAARERASVGTAMVYG
jgi:hypothetical protein